MGGRVRASRCCWALLEGGGGGTGVSEGCLRGGVRGAVVERFCPVRDQTAAGSSVVRSLSVRRSSVIRFGEAEGEAGGFLEYLCCIRSPVLRVFHG